MALAKELGYTLSEIAERMTVEELILWSTHYEIQKDEMEKQNRRRR